jgi:hypothetical protein
MESRRRRTIFLLSKPEFLFYLAVARPATYSFNITAVPPGPLGYATVWPAGQQQPSVSTLNDVTCTVVANAAIVPAGMGGGDIDVLASNNTDLVVDVT